MLKSRFKKSDPRRACASDKNANPPASPASLAIRLLSIKAMSLHELSKFLKKKNYAEDEIALLCERLKKMGLINDEKFARDFALSRMKNKRWGRVKIKFELEKKGVPEEIIVRTISGLDRDEELAAARLSLKKWLKKNPSTPGKNPHLIPKAIKHLMAKGFSFETIRLAVRIPFLSEEQYDEIQ